VNLLFDLDGTLTDPKAGITRSIAHALARMGVQPPASEALLPHHGIEAARAVMIGDRGADMVAARHHGLRALGVRWGYGDEAELLEAGAHALCDAPPHLPGALHALPTPT